MTLLFSANVLCIKILLCSIREAVIILYLHFFALEPSGTCKGFSLIIVTEFFFHVKSELLGGLMNTTRLCGFNCSKIEVNFNL